MIVFLRRFAKFAAAAAFIGAFSYLMGAARPFIVKGMFDLNIAAAGFFDEIHVPTIDELRSDATATSTAAKGLRILIVPGHEPDFGGTRFKDVYERDMTAELGQDLAGFIGSETGYHVFITRTDKAWTSAFAEYFKDDMDAIKAWERASRANAPTLATLGKPGVGAGASAPAPVVHNTAPPDVAFRLYGITKWANDDKIDLMIHIHFNDYPGHSSRVPGRYSGFVIYVPARQYSNSTTTQAIADSVYKRLALMNPTSDLPIESKGIVDDPELIAVGANNTSDAASMLIEYEYIYEPQFLDPKVRPIALRDLAYQTYLGLQDFFTSAGAPNTVEYDPRQVYDWTKPGTDRYADPRDIYALQTALIMEGAYPPLGKTMHECPHSGTFGPCTSAALKAFQAKHGITDEPNVVGKKSFDILNKIYSHAI